MSGEDLQARLADRSAPLSGDDILVVQELFTRDPAEAVRLAAQWRIDDLLSRCLDPGRSDFRNRVCNAIGNGGTSSRFIERVRVAARAEAPARHRFRTWWVTALAACLLVAIGLAWRGLAAVPDVTVAASGGRIERDGARMRLETGRPLGLRAGDRLVAEGVAQELRYADGTAIALAPGGIAEFRSGLRGEEKRLRLEVGTLDAVVTAQPPGRPLRIATPQAEVMVIGTRFRLAVAGGATRLEVIAGSVALSRKDDPGLIVLAGQSAVAEEGTALRILPPDSPATARRPDGLPGDPESFPIGVWAQDPADAEAFRRAGVNLFVYLWSGPTEAQLTALTAAGMRTVCPWNETAARHLADPTIAGWILAACPDLQPEGSGGEPKLDPQEVVRRYEEQRRRDPTRPVLLSLGAAAWTADPRRGSRRTHPEDYPAYVQGGDILASECFPLNAAGPPVRGNLWQVPLGIDHVRDWSAGAKPVWAWIECTRIWATTTAGPTPAQVRSQVWMALIHGAKGIVYFCHSWATGVQDTRALLRDPGMLAAISALNREIASLASILATPTLPGLVTVTSDDQAVPVEALAKREGKALYIFAAAMRDGATTAGFRVPTGGSVRVIGENRTLPIVAGMFNDRFEPYAVHLYAITDPAQDF